jgi:hypothetical protein
MYTNLCLLRYYKLNKKNTHQHKSIFHVLNKKNQQQPSN